MTDVPQLPLSRPTILDLAPEIADLRNREEPSAVRTPAGDRAWLVTGYDQVRALFGDRRLGRSHPGGEPAPAVSDSAIMGGPVGDHDTEHVDHKRMRSLLTPAFSARRMRALEEHVAALTTRCLDELEAARDRPVDLHAYLSFPLPALVISELLGIPEEDRTYFRGLSDRASRMGSGGDAAAAMAEFGEYLGGVLRWKRDHPAPDVLSDLVRAQDGDPSLTDARLLRIAVGLLFAGHETTVDRIDLGVVLLLADTARRDALLADPEGRVAGVVEEVLRMAAPADLGLLRYAHQDIEVGGRLIRRGDAVLLSASAANRDPAAFPDPSGSTPHARGLRTSPSATARTSASAPAWPVRSCAWCSRRCSPGSPRCGWPPACTSCPYGPARSPVGSPRSRSPGDRSARAFEGERQPYGVGA